MSTELTEGDKQELNKIFGNVMAEQMMKVFAEIKSTNENNKRITDARYGETQTKLNTIINLLGKGLS